MKNITLIGMPGSGKSTLGRLLAQHLDYAFVDTDHLLEAAYSMRLQDVTDMLSHDDFLNAEADVVASLNVNNCVIATGGSVIYRERAMEYLAGLGPIVFLQTSLEALEKRIAACPERGIAFPPGQDLAGLYRERMKLYKKYAQYTCDTADRGVLECAEEIMDSLELK